MPERPDLSAPQRNFPQVRNDNGIIAENAIVQRCHLRVQHVGRTVTRMAKTLKLDEFLPYRLSIASNTVSDAVASAYRTLFGARRGRRDEPAGAVRADADGQGDGEPRCDRAR